MHVTVRKAVERDFPEVLLLINEFALFQKTPAKVKITLEQMIREKHTFNCIVAETGNKEIAGFATFFNAYYSWSGRAIYLDDLYVKMAFRKMAIGRKLLLFVIDIARQEQCVKLRWQVSKWNEDAILFYKQMGAVVDETEINCDLHIDA